jgi:hypothetical protein
MELLAKSNPPQTLEEHINEALKIEEILKSSFANVRLISCDDNFW